MTGSGSPGAPALSRAPSTPVAAGGTPGGRSLDTQAPDRQRLLAAAAALRAEIAKRVVGQHEVLDEILMALVAGGHPAATEKTIATLDGALAELADRLPRTAAADRTDPEAEEASALAVLQQRLVDERTALQSELSRVQGELEHLQASPEHRIARPIREGYQRWQRRRT